MKVEFKYEEENLGKNQVKLSKHQMRFRNLVVSKKYWGGILNAWRKPTIKIYDMA